MPRRRLLVLALMPALLSGCAALPGFSADPPADRAGSATADGVSWLVATRGSAPPSPRASFGPRPSPSATGGFLPLGAPAPTGTPTDRCLPNTFNFSRIDGLDVTAAATGATLNWYNVGGANLVEFRLYAISQDLTVGPQRDVGYVVVKPRRPCGAMSATIGNLDRATRYVFSVDAVVLRRSGDGTHSATIARSAPLRTR